MCGIWSTLNKAPNSAWPEYADAVARRPRGPEQTDSTTCNLVHHVFHHLYNGLDDASMMPLEIDDCILICM